MWLVDPSCLLVNYFPLLAPDMHLAGILFPQCGVAYVNETLVILITLEGVLPLNILIFGV